MLGKNGNGNQEIGRNRFGPWIMDKKKKKSWFNEKCKEAISERDKAHLRVVQNSTEDNKKNVSHKTKKGKKNN